MSKTIPPQQVIAQEKFDETPLESWKGIQIQEFTDDMIRAHLEIKESHIAPNGYLFAGVLVGFADSVCAAITVHNLPSLEHSFTTQKIDTSFLATKRNGILECVVTKRHVGRSTQLWDAEVIDYETGKVLALVRVLQMVLDPR